MTSDWRDPRPRRGKDFRCRRLATPDSTQRAIAGAISTVNIKRPCAVVVAPKRGEWPGEATVSPFYDRWDRAGNAERKAGMRMARTKPTTTAGAAAMINHIQCEIEARSDSVEDWLATALKTVAGALVRMEAA